MLNFMIYKSVKIIFFYFLNWFFKKIIKKYLVKNFKRLGNLLCHHSLEKRYGDCKGNYRINKEYQHVIPDS